MYQTQDQFNRLYRAISRSNERMQPFRNNRLKFLKVAVGKHHSENGSDEREPINSLLQYIAIHLRVLASHNPQMLVSSPHAELTALALDIEAWGNWRIGEMNLSSTLRRGVFEAFVGVGIFKVGLTLAHSFEATNHDTTEVFVDCISLDDYFQDMRAKTPEQMYFQGHRYSMPLDDAKAEELFDGDRRMALQPGQRSNTNDGGYETAKAIESEPSIADDDYTDFVDLCEIFLPREQVILTCEWTPGGIIGKPLRVMEWRGPKAGPFHLLSFLTPPDNIMPIAPAGTVFDLAELINQQMRKLANQTQNSKTVLAYQGNAEADARRVMEAFDGAVIPVTNINALKELHFRGADQAELAFMQQNIQIFDRAAGNLSTIGGLKTEAPTLGQEEILNGNAGSQIRDMQAMTVSLMKSVYRSMAWHWMFNADQTYFGQRQIPGTDYKVPITITPEARRGKFLALNFEIEPFSASPKTPDEKNAQIDQLLTQILIPLAPILAQEGTVINWQTVLRLKAKYLGMTDLDNMLTFGSPAPLGEPRLEPPSMPSATTRTNVRVNRSEASDNGRAIVQMQQAQGQDDGSRVAVGA